MRCIDGERSKIARHPKVIYAQARIARIVKLRELAVPLQAFMAMTFCVGLVWMIYAVAFFDATPPSALEVRALVTQDVQINDLRTAAAMTVDALFGFGPTPILLPTYTFTPTLTPTSTLVSFSTVATTPT